MELAAVSLDEAPYEAMNLHATHDPAGVSRPAGMKFTYASGSRPLEGYTIKRGVGRGGFGEVYYATSDAGKEVALKLIRRNLDVELRGVTQCLNLKHPNLVSLYDVKQDELGDSWVIMEYVAGESLEGMLQRHPDGLTGEDVLAWFHGIAAGVTYLHDHGIVHRDLKPGNIFGDEGIVKIGDYGLSKFISASRRSGQTESVGTVHYMAPEIGNGRYGKEIDIYALGIILYEMLTGRVPFEGESVGEVLMKHLTAEPNLTEIEEPYRSLIARTLTKNPDERIKTVPEMLAVLPPPPPGVFVGASGKTNLLENDLNAGGRPAGGPSPAVAPAAGQARRPSPRKGVELVSAVLVADEEPIARAVRVGFRRFSTGWNSGSITPPGKVAIILVGAYVVVTQGILIFSAIVPLAMAYAFYYAVRTIAIACRAPSERATLAHRPKPAAVAVRPVAQGMAEIQARVPLPPAVPAVHRTIAPATARRPVAERPTLPPKTARRRFEELLGSLLGSMLIAAVMSIFLSVVHAKTIEPGQFAWLLIVSTLGSWLVLIPGKFWEGREDDPTLRRLTLMVLGLGLGAAAWSLKDFLMVSLTSDWQLPSPVTEGYMGTRFHEVDGQPSLVGHMGYFAFLFLLVRWWKQADPMRTSRLRLWPTIVTIFWAWTLYFFWPFPQPWGMMAAASISIAVQVAASWERTARRLAS